jgi:hypothetical protein
VAATVGRRSGRAVWEPGVSRRGDGSTSAVRRRGQRGIGSTRRPPRGLCGKGGGAVAGHVDVLGGHRPQRPGAVEDPIPENREHRAVGCPGPRRRSGFHCPTPVRRGVGLGESSSEFEAITDHHPTQGRRRPRGLGLNSRPRPPGARGVMRPRAPSAAGARGGRPVGLGRLPCAHGDGIRDSHRPPKAGRGDQTQFREWEAGGWGGSNPIPGMGSRRLGRIQDLVPDRRGQSGGLGARPGRPPSAVGWSWRLT